MTLDVQVMSFVETVGVHRSRKWTLNLAVSPVLKCTQPTMAVESAGG
jgi:hypothetical protein